MKRSKAKQSIAQYLNKSFSVTFTYFKALLTAVFILLLSACGDKAQTALRIGLTSWPGYEVLAWADHKGQFKAAGVAVQLTSFDSDAAIRAAYERGEIDGMATTVLGVLHTRENSARAPMTVYVLDYSNGGDTILAREGIRSVAELAGRKVAIEPGTINLYVLKRALDIAKLKMSDIQLVTMPQSKMTEAFINGEVDAVVSYPPVSVDLFARPDVHEIFTSRDIPEEVVDVLLFDKEIVQNRADDIAKMLKAYQGAMDSLTDEAFTFMAEREKISVEQLKKALSDDLNLESLDEQEAYFTPGGRLERVFTMAQQTMRANGDLKGTYTASELLARGPVRQAKDFK